MSVEEWFRDSNGPAYQKHEIRKGPPLDYVGEKLRYCAEATYDTLAKLNAGRKSISKEQFEELSSSSGRAFYCAVVTFLALYNMLGSAGTSQQVMALANRSRAEFEKWLDLIEREGAVAGSDV